MKQENYDNEVNGYLIRCNVGCLDHIIGISYFKWENDSIEEPELYYESTHAPYHTFWERLKACWKHLFHGASLDSDGTLIGYEDAKGMLKLLGRYLNDYEAYLDGINKG